MTGPRIDPLADYSPNWRKPSSSEPIERGNIDLKNRPRVKNPDGSISTVRSMSANIDGREVLMPTVSEDGRILSNDEAIEQYRKTGKHLGIFRDPASATAYAEQLHNDQAKMIGASDPLADYRSNWRNTPSVPGAASDATSALPRNRPNASGDFQAATKNIGGQAGFVGRGVAANVLNAAQGVPGMKAYEAAAGALGSWLTEHPMSYRESHDALTAETEKIPAAIRYGERMIGALPLAGMLPAKTVMQAAKSGSALGAADQALNADPDVGLGERAVRTGIGAATGAVVGGGVAAGIKGGTKAADLLRKAQRVKDAPTMGASALDQTKRMNMADVSNYGQAEAEAITNGKTNPMLASALEHPRVKTLAEKFRASEDGPVDDATVGMETYKLMSKQWKALDAKMNRDGWDADVALEIKKIKAGQKVLKDALGKGGVKPAVTMDIAPEVFETAPKVTPGREPATGPIADGTLAERTTAPSDPTLRQALRDFPQSSLPPKMQGPAGPAFQLNGQPDKVTPGVRIETPGMRVQTAPAEEIPAMSPTFPKAVATHAKAENARKKFDMGANAAQRIMRGTPLRAEKQDTQSEEAFLDKVLGMRPDEAEMVLQGVLGRAKEGVGVKMPYRMDSFFGSLANNTVGPAVRMNRLSPIIDALDKQTGKSIPKSALYDELMKYLSVANSPFASK